MSKATTICPKNSTSRARALPLALLVPLACLLFAAPAPAAAAPAWLAPTELSAPGRDASEPVAAMDEAGETVAVWQRQSEGGVGEVVQGATRSPSAAFSAPLELSAAAGEPTVAMSPSGEAVAVWRHFEIKGEEGLYAIQVSYRRPGGSFSAPLDVAVTPSTAIPQDIHVAIDPSGDTAVVWTRQEPESSSAVVASIRPAGGEFSPPEAISPPPASGVSVSSPSVAIDAAGEAIAVWAHRDAGSTAVQAARGTATAGFGSPVELSKPGQPAFSPAIATSPTGEATAVWVRSNEEATENVIEAATAPPGGGFSVPSELSDPAQSAFEPQVTASPSGAQTAVWTRSNGANFIVEADSGSGGSFGSPVALSEPGESAERPQLAESPNGTTAIVWKRSNGANEIVQGVVGSPGAYSAPANLSAAGQDSQFPMVAIDGAGDATAVWKRSNGANEIVEAAGYDADAPQLHDLSIPALGMAGVPVSFSVSPFDVWPIASTGFDFGDGAGASGASVTHTYTEPGTYRVTATASDAAGTPVSAAGTISIQPSNRFAIGRLSRNRRRGTATLFLTVPGPGRLVLSGKAVRKTSRRARRAGRVKLPVRARGAALRRLARRGKVRLVLKIAFTPDGGTTLVEEKGVMLVKGRHT